MICENHNSFIFITLGLILQEFCYTLNMESNHIHNISSVKSPKIRYL